MAKEKAPAAKETAREAAPATKAKKVPAPPKPAAPPPAAAPAAVPAVAAPRAPRAPRDIGIDVPAPKAGCEDAHCPFHGTLSVRGQTLDGVVVSTKMVRTVVVERDSLRYIRKFERYERRTRRMLAHAPPCLALAPGNRVTLMECRPLSKTVSFVVIRNRGVAG